MEGKAIARMEPHVSGWIPPRSAQWGGFAAGIALFAVLWLTEFGEREGMKRYLADYDGVDRSRPPDPPKIK